MAVEVKREKKKRRKAIINITSLIDVLFLLLIFFMVSSTFMEQPGIKLDLPSAKTSEYNKMEDVILSVTKSEKIYLNDSLVTKKELSMRLKEIPISTTIVLKADKAASFGVIIEIMDIIKQTGLKKVVAMTKVAEVE